MQTIQQNEQTAPQRSQNTALAAHRAAANAVHSDQDMMMRLVEERVASGQPWRLGPLQKDFESHEEVVKDLTNPVSATVSFKLMNMVTRALQRKRPPRKDSIEATFMSLL